MPGFCYSARLRNFRYVAIAMSPPPPGAFQKPSDYEKGDKVWAEDAGELLCGMVDIKSINTECDAGTWWTGAIESPAASSGQHWEVTITLPNGETRSEKKSKDELRMRP